VRFPELEALFGKLLPPMRRAMGTGWSRPHLPLALGWQVAPGL
jgi:hypothetical protein